PSARAHRPIRSERTGQPPQGAGIMIAYAFAPRPSLAMTSAPPIRVVLAKVGLDGHDRGIKVVARALRDAGMHVIYAGLWQTPEAVVRTVADEDADWVGISLLSGAHMTRVPRLPRLLRAPGLGHVGVLVGGIIPEADAPRLLEMGVARVFGPGPSLDEIVASLREPRQAGHAG